MKDLYFEPNYGKLNEEIEEGISIVYEYSGDYGEIYHMFIKREIETEVDGGIWYDLITPYGYGGPIILECEGNKEGLLIGEFNKSFKQYCIDNNIVSEFIRFHPMYDNAKDFKNMYDVFYNRNTIATNLADSEDPFQTEFSKSCRKNVRRALREGISYRVIEDPSDISNFKEIYYSTMDRNEATDYYYFEEEYFDQCLKLLGNNLILVEAIYQEKTIAMGFYFVYDKNIHIHLSGTLSEFLHLSPAYILRYAVTQWGKEQGYKIIHHGGGRSSSEEDSLYKFKKQFGKTEFEFYIGKKIWNQDIYDKICKAKGVDKDSDFFPLYREVH